MTKLIKFVLVVLCLSSFMGTALAAKTFTSAEKQQIATEYETAQFISLAVATCAGTYVPGGEAAEYSYLTDYGWKIRPYTLTNNGIEANFMVAYNNSKVTKEHLYVLAFRGSASKQDWQVDLTTSRVIYGGHTLEEFVEVAKQSTEDKKAPKVHKGFNEYVRTALTLELDINDDGVSEDLIELLKTDKKTKLLITGHSLGGAAATLYAERLVSLGIPKEQVPVITFGAPAVGNAVFAQEYGDKINLLRIVTPYDPVPVGLQALIGGYQQFGPKKVLELSTKVADYQHPISFYFDLSLSNYYRVRDQAIAAGIIDKLPEQKIAGKEPLFAVMVGELKHISKIPYAPDIRRFITNEYKNTFPRYVILDNTDNKYADATYGLEELLAAAREAKADYLLVAEIDGTRMGQENKWYIVMNQSVFNIDGGLVLMNSSGRRVTFESGIMQSAINDVQKTQKELQQKFPWLSNRSFAN
ncbi:MAG: lipase family protein [Acidaminococcaceae bacterium]